VREVAWWAIPGFVVAGPAALLSESAGIRLPVIAWLVSAPVIGFLLHQATRCSFEARGNGFRSRKRAALAAIIELGGLSDRRDAGDIAYQTYEVVFYQRPDWQAVRDHLHRCWFYVLWFWTITLASALGSVTAAVAWAAGAPKSLALLCLIASPAIGWVLWKKGCQTHAALELFDRGLVVAHWPRYEEVMRTLLAPQPETARRTGFRSV
jgi:hypothetical protein